MWAVALAVEVSMYTLFSDLFGSYPLRVFIHGCLFVGFLALTFVEWRRALARLKRLFTAKIERSDLGKI